jgi:hypothetical protein
MRDFTEAQISKFRPNGTALDTVNFCLKHLFEDKNHLLTHGVVYGLTFEELLGALLLARDGLSREGE